VQVALWLSIALVVFIYFGYPAVIYLIAKLWAKSPSKVDIEPFISLIVAVHNEERVIRDRMANILSLDYPADKLEVLFALDGCTDRTKEFIKECGNGRIKTLDIEQRGGKVNALNKAVKEAQGEIVVLSDANSITGEDALRKLVRNFSDEKVGCVCGRLRYTEADTTSVGKGESLYWKYEYFIKIQESKLGRLPITNGSAQAIRKNIYPFPDPEVADDFSIPVLVQAKSYKVLYEPEAVVSEVATQSLKEEFNQKVRIISQGLKGIVRLRKDILKMGFLGIFEILSHKLLRWLVPFFLAFVLLSNALLVKNAFYFYLFILQIAFYFFALAGFLLRNKVRLKIFYIPFYFCLVNLAALAAVYRFLRGEQTRMWDKAHSTRVKRDEVRQTDKVPSTEY